MSLFARECATYDAQDRLHKIDGPALLYTGGYQEWRVHGELHRYDGPAVVEINGNPDEWWILGYDITDDVFAWMEETSVNSNWREWTDEDKILFLLRFG